MLALVSLNLFCMRKYKIHWKNLENNTSKAWLKWSHTKKWRRIFDKECGSKRWEIIYVFGNHKSLLITPSRARCVCGGFIMFLVGSSLALPFFATLLYELISMVLQLKVFNWIKIMVAKICHFIIIFAMLMLLARRFFFFGACNFSRTRQKVANFFRIL